MRQENYEAVEKLANKHNVPVSNMLDLLISEAVIARKEKIERPTKNIRAIIDADLYDKLLARKWKDRTSVEKVIIKSIREYLGNED